MNALFKTIFSDKILLWSFSAAFVCIILSLIAVLLSYSHLPFLVPIYNQLPWGPDRLGQRTELFIPLGVTLLIFITNMILTSKFYEKMPLVARMFSATTFIISLLLFAFLVRTIQLVL